MPGGQRKRQVVKKLTESSDRWGPITYEDHKEDTFIKTWRDTSLYGGAKKLNTPQIGGQVHGQGPDALKFIRKFDPNNESGTVKKALDIMTKFKASMQKGTLEQTLQPIENILGSSLFGAMKAAGAAAVASEKVEEVAPEEDIIMELIAAALAMCSDEEKIIVSQLLDETEINLIRTAYYGNGVYISGQPTMPVTFVNAINQLIPIFRMKEAQR